MTVFERTAASEIGITDRKRTDLVAGNRHVGRNLDSGRFVGRISDDDFKTVICGRRQGNIELLLLVD